MQGHMHTLRDSAKPAHLHDEDLLALPGHGHFPQVDEHVAPRAALGFLLQLVKRVHARLGLCASRLWLSRHPVRLLPQHHLLIGTNLTKTGG